MEIHSYSNCIDFYSNFFSMDDSRSRRSVASLGDLQKELCLEDQPPDITPIGGVPNLKVA